MERPSTAAVGAVQLSVSDALARRLRRRHDVVRPAGPAVMVRTVPTPDAGGGGRPEGTSEVFAGDVPLVTGSRRLTCWSRSKPAKGGERFRLGVDGVGVFAIGLGEGGEPWARQLTAAEAGGDPAPDADAEMEILLGPVLILGLALAGVFCLHAAAAAPAAGGGAVLFAGDSGAGKSTLAAYLGGEAGWRRLSDDVTPVAVAAGGARVLPRFPQLKVPPGMEGPPPEVVPLAAVCVLPSSQPASGGAPELTPSPPGEAVTDLLHHTIASRLFDRPLLARHLRWATEVGASCGVWRLAYPHHRSMLPAVVGTLRDTVSSAPSAG